METRKCTICKENLPLNSEYYSNRQYKGNNVYQAACKKCHKEYRRQHYIDNIDKYKDKAIKYRRNFIELFKEYKKSLCCEFCKDDRHWVLDFHHTDKNEKDIEISLLVRKSSKRLLDKELEKCIVLCANCHRDLHYKEKLANNA